MTTEKQIAANRLNAQKSTGPRSPQGKTIASQNALTLGLFSRQILLRDEDPALFDPFYRSLLRELAPVGTLEFLLAERIIASFWRLRRAGQMESAVLNLLCSQQERSDRFLKPFNKLLQLTPPNSQEPDPDSFPETLLGKVVKSDFQNDNLISHLLQYEGRMERSLYRTISQLQKLQYIRNLSEPNPKIEKTPV